MLKKRLASTLACSFVAATFWLAGATVVSAQSTMDIVKSRGTLKCGASDGLAGFGIPDAQGVWSGLDVDLCRAIAAAIFNDPMKVDFARLSAKDRFTALQSKEIDVLSRVTTWTFSRDVQFGLNFAGINFYDGQGFMVKKSLGVISAKGLGGASICVIQGTTSELNVADFFRTNNLKFDIVTFAGNDEATKAYESGRCDALTNDSSGLSAERLKLTNAADHIVLPDLISKEPLGPVVRHGDDQWFDLVKWTHFVMISAEELGITRANVDEMLKSTNPDVRRLLGVEGKYGEQLGLANDWGYRIIRHVGNYGESFERNLGQGSVLKITRGSNALWTKGGLQYAPPLR
jgi:general L-amino acid transport system substrate-binding protein